MFAVKDTPRMASSLFQAYASLAASMMMIRSMANDIVPHELRSYIGSKFHYLFTPLSKNLTIIIDEYSGMARNQVYDAVEIYLQTKLSPSNSCIRVSKTQKQKNFTITIVNGEEIVDEFENYKLNWRFVYAEPQQNGRVQEKKFFELGFNKKFKDRVLDSYLPYVMDRAQKILKEDKVVRLYSRDCPFDDDIRSPGGCNGNQWGSINLEHPCTFDTIALDPELKKMIIDDLDRFLRRKEFYKKVGKAWKRGYLLYGPPGTGKSSLIAAMANYLKFDIYDLDLTSVYSDSDLRRVLLSTTNRSILVIEDIDCSVEAKDRHVLEDHQEPYSNQFTKFTLSGLLNFIDGLWSSCGDERIIIFTTNHKEKLDPALLRPGRMDMHVNLSYCTVDVFKQLSSNYLSIDDNHSQYGEIEELIQSTNVTPAEVAEELMRSEDADVALEGVARLLKRKKKQEGEIEDDASEGQQGKKLKIIDDDDEKCVGRNRRMCVEARRRLPGRFLSSRGRGRGRRGRGSFRLFI